MRFLPLIWSNLRRKKLRTLLTILSILIVFILLDEHIAGALQRHLRSAFTYTLDLSDQRRLLEAEDPLVEEISTSDFPIMQVNVTGDVGLVRLKQIAEDLQERIEGIRGVLRAQLVGGRERESASSSTWRASRPTGSRRRRWRRPSRARTSTSPGAASSWARPTTRCASPGSSRTRRRSPRCSSAAPAAGRSTCATS